MTDKQWTAYLSGEIHTPWRDEVRQALGRSAPVWRLTSPNTNHDESDGVGEKILGREDKGFWKDHKAAKINAIRIRSLVQEADVVVVRFGDKYKQWNAAFDAGYAAALGKPLVVIHDPSLTHALKEVDASALAVAESPIQVAEILQYVSQAQD